MCVRLKQRATAPLRPRCAASCSRCRRLAPPRAAPPDAARAPTPAHPRAQANWAYVYWYGGVAQSHPQLASRVLAAETHVRRQRERHEAPVLQAALEAPAVERLHLHRVEMTLKTRCDTSALFTQILAHLLAQVLEHHELAVGGALLDGHCATRRPMHVHLIHMHALSTTRPRTRTKHYCCYS